MYTQRGVVDGVHLARIVWRPWQEQWAAVGSTTAGARHHRTPRLEPQRLQARYGDTQLVHEPPEFFRLKRHLQMRYPKGGQGINDGISHR